MFLLGFIGFAFIYSGNVSIQRFLVFVIVNMTHIMKLNFQYIESFNKMLPRYQTTRQNRTCFSVF